MFKTELHCHSADVSQCAKADVDSIVNNYLKSGYSTVVLTNHFASFTYNYLECKSWQDWIDKYLYGYQKLKEAGNGRLEILLGIELRPQGNPNDYLFYGVDEAFLRNNEFLYENSVEQLSKIAKDNGILFIQAHPFRDNMQITPPHLIDGIEVYNGSALGHYGTDSRNGIAKMWADKFDFIKTSGTDLHYGNDTVCAGILTEKKITHISQLVQVLKSKNYEIIRG